MTMTRWLFALLNFAAVPMATAHDAGGVNHRPMFFHWHVENSSVVLGLPVSSIGIALIGLAAIVSVAAIRITWIRRSHSAVIALTGTSLLLAFMGAGLLTGMS